MKWLLIFIFSIGYSVSQGSVEVVTTNAHHHSVQYWLKRQLKLGDIKGLPLIHFDSHSDMGFIPSSFKFRNTRVEALNLIDNLSAKKIKAFQDSLTDISQVIVPAVTTGLTKDVHMCMPPWFIRVPKDESTILFSVTSLNKAQFENASVDRSYPVTKVSNTFLESPFFHHQRLGGESFSMQFYDCFKGPELNIKSDYILSLDLDIFSTSGSHGDHARPISTARGQAGEEAMVKLRAKKVKATLLELREKGFYPRIVTIAKSTGAIGGDYTPNEFAENLNKEFRDFFKLEFPSRR